MIAYILCVFFYTFEENVPQKGVYHLHIPILNDCIYACLVNRNQQGYHSHGN